MKMEWAREREREGSQGDAEKRFDVGTDFIYPLYDHKKKSSHLQCLCVCRPVHLFYSCFALFLCLASHVLLLV
jgi:hypothetical protein